LFAEHLCGYLGIRCVCLKMCFCSECSLLACYFEIYWPEPQETLSIVVLLGFFDIVVYRLRYLPGQSDLVMDD
jgi:hypothetical protein